MKWRLIMNHHLYKIFLLFIAFFLAGGIASAQSAYFGGKGDGHAMAEVSKLEEVSSLKTKNNNSIAIIPNPVKKGDRLSISGLSADYHYTFELLSIDGRPVKKGHLSNDITTIGLANVQPGIWLLKISSGRIQHYEKIVVTGK